MTLIMYADDTVIYSSSYDIQIAVEKVQNALDTNLKWCDLNKLTVNENKNKFTTFLQKPSGEKYRKSCKNTFLERTPNYDYLGVDLYHTLSMDPFVKNVCTKINVKMYMLKKIRKFVTTHAAVMIYTQTILPYFNYGSFLMTIATLEALSKFHKYKNEL